MDTQALPAGVQQNTATILSGDRLLSYGVDSGGQRLVECARDAVTGAKACNTLASAVGAFANYVGAAVTPRGHRMAWLTNVKDGGGGTFSFFANYGAGWNGPRQGSVGGYNDASYVNVAFGVNGDPDRFTMHGELVSGLAPSWSFVGAVGEGNVATPAPVTWTVGLPAPPGDPVVSTNDVLVDPRTGDTHLVARTRSAAAAVYFRAKNGAAFLGPTEVIPGAFRARLVSLSSGALALVRSDEVAGGIALHVVPASAVKANEPVVFGKISPLRPPLPEGYGSIYAIYTESASYAATPRSTLEVALVGRTREREVLHVSVAGL